MVTYRLQQKQINIFRVKKNVFGNSNTLFSAAEINTACIVISRHGLFFLAKLFQFIGTCNKDVTTIDKSLQSSFGQLRI